MIVLFLAPGWLAIAGWRRGRSAPGPDRPLGDGVPAVALSAAWSAPLAVLVGPTLTESWVGATTVGRAALLLVVLAVVVGVPALFGFVAAQLTRPTASEPLCATARLSDRTVVHARARPPSLGHLAIVRVAVRPGNEKDDRLHRHRGTLWYMARSGYLSLRVSPSTLRRLDRRALIAGTRKGSLAGRYVEEGLRMDDHPGVHFVDGPMGRRPALAATGLDVWEVVETVQHNDGDPAAAAAYLRVTRGVVDAALAYHGEYRDEIDGWIERVRELAAADEARWQRAQDALA